MGSAVLRAPAPVAVETPGRAAETLHTVLEEGHVPAVPCARRGERWSPRHPSPGGVTRDVYAKVTPWDNSRQRKGIQCICQISNLFFRIS